MRVLVCGSRDWGVTVPATNPYNLKEPWYDPERPDSRFTVSILDGLHRTYGLGLHIIEGAAQGADSIAWDFGRSRLDEGKLHHYPANWSKHHKAAGPIRNAQMLSEGNPDLVLAFTNDWENSRGTKDMVRRAAKAGVPYYVTGSLPVL